MSVDTPAAPPASLEPTRKLAETAEVLAIVAVVLIVINLAVSHGYRGVIAPIAANEVSWDMARAVLQAVGRESILMAPAICLLAAVSWLGTAFGAYAKGEFFGSVAPRAVRMAGEWAIAGLVFKVLVTPSVHAWVTEEFRGVIVDYETTDLGIAAFVVFTAIVGRVLEAASALKAENDAFL